VAVTVRTEELQLQGTSLTAVRRQARKRAPQQFVIRRDAIRKHRGTLAIANLPRNTYFQPATASVR
jgi:hypothetical protein